MKTAENVTFELLSGNFRVTFTGTPKVTFELCRATSGSQTYCLKRCFVAILVVSEPTLRVVAVTCFDEMRAYASARKVRTPSKGIGRCVQTGTRCLSP